MKEKGQTKEKVVLVGVLKNKTDLGILFRERWYRIPVDYAPKRQFTPFRDKSLTGFNYLAFYQPVSFDRQGKQIEYFARVLGYQTVKRKDLLPGELGHPRAEDYYFRVRIGKIKKLAQPIRNIRPRRISFGFTTLSHLLESKDILELYNVPPIEEIVEDALKKTGIKAISQHYLSINKKRFCLDLAIFCQKGKIAIECDGKKAHSSPAQQKKDKIKDNFLRGDGWRVIRLKESAILSNLKSCLLRIQKAIQKLGGSVV